MTPIFASAIWLRLLRLPGAQTRYSIPLLSRLARSLLFQLDEHSVGRLGMDERDQVPAGSPPRLLVDELRPRSREVRERFFDVLDLETDMVHPLPALFEERRDGRAPPHGLQN